MCQTWNSIPNIGTKPKENKSLTLWLWGQGRASSVCLLAKLISSELEQVSYQGKNICAPTKCLFSKSDLVAYNPNTKED